MEVMLGGLTQGGRVDEAHRLFEMIPHKDVVTMTNIIGSYFQAGRLAEARQRFDEMPHRNIVSWTMMITGYVQNGRVGVARMLFQIMPENNEVSWMSMLMEHQSGRMEEALELFNEMSLESVNASNAMVLGFGQMSEVGKARQVFDQMREKGDGIWSVIIKVRQQKGLELEAIDLFSLMQKGKS